MAAVVIVSLGSINADFVYRLDGPPPTEGAVLTPHVLRLSGGKAANVAVFARRLGVAARLVGCVGDDDLAEQALRGPRQAGVDLTDVHKVAGATAVSTVLVPPSGSKAIVLASEANMSDEWPSVTHVVEGLPAPAVLVVDLEVPTRAVIEAVKAARAVGVAVVLDPAPADHVSDELLAMADHVTPDHHEAEVLTGIEVDGVDAAGRAAAQLHERGAGAAYVKLADGGCVLRWTDGDAVIRAPRVESVDATGAGDAFAAAVAWATLLGRDPLEAAVAGVAASTCAVQTLGSQESYPTAAELEAMCARVTVE